MSAIAPDPSPSRTEIGLTLLRLGVGFAFLAHGHQKLFDLGIPAVTAGFITMSIPLAGIVAPLVTVLEFFGGIALLLGVLTRLAALGFVIDMLGAIFLVHIKHGYFPPLGAELPILLCIGSATLALAGGGTWSVDRMLRRLRTTPGIPG